MSYKTILVYLQNSKRAKSLLDVAVPLANRHDAHLIGLFITPDIPLHPLVEIHLPEEIILKQQRAIEQEGEAVSKAFDKATDEIYDKSEWRNPTCLHSGISDMIVDHALAADLVVISQDDDDQLGPWPDFPADVALGSSRPVLVIPKDRRFEPIGNKVIVAWNASREASRAAFDAVPVMKDAKEVHVMAIVPESDSKHNISHRGDELAAALARHDIKAHVSASWDEALSVGDTLISRAEDNNFDLIVMGCYGHSRLRESMFGGVSRNILREMKVPVLMSH